MNIFEEQRVSSRVDFSLPEKLDCHFAGRRKTAFTLAEVLITLGIIGVVAALTMPILIENHQKRVVETRLQKFYSVFNSALRASVAENGDMSNWTFPADYYDWEGADVFFETYLKKYLVYKKTKRNVHTIWPTYGTEIYLNDGSAFVVSGGPWITYYPVAKKTKHAGVEVFVFAMDPSKNTMLPLSLRAIQNYGQHIDWVDAVEYSCNPESRNTFNRVCATYIMLNSWKIPDNYPFNGLKNNNKY
ncbi:type II secretion system protein [bacterium]|nr:type II secretion system protein [bacterium]